MKNRVRRAVLSVTAAVTTALVPVGLPATADTEGGSVVPRLQSATEAEAQDLALVAEANGWTIEQAAADRRAADIVGHVVGRVALERPDIFVGSRLSTDPNGVPELYVKGSADLFIRGLVDQAEGPIRIIDNQPFSFQELEERKLQVHAALEAQGFTTVATGFSIAERGLITAGVTRRSGLPTVVSTILAKLPVSLRGNVKLTVNDLPIVREEDAFGGMWVRDDGVNECTSGWPVYDANGQTGVTTAGHCDGINQIDHPGHGVHALTHQREHRGAWGDIEWKTSAEVEPARFYATATEIRGVGAIEPRSNISENESVCLYGRSSNNRQCARVSRVSFTCTGGGDRNDRLVVTDRDLGIAGDSGGTWSWSATAYGSHEGNCAELPGQEAFTVADLYDEAIGVRVRTDRILADVSNTLETGERLISDDGRFTAWMQTDGNFVVYQNGIGAIWAADRCGQTTFGTGFRAVMQPTDGNFVVYTPDNAAAWATSFPQTQPGCPSVQQTTFGTGHYMVMQNDGNLVMRNPSGPVWDSRTCRR